MDWEQARRMRKVNAKGRAEGTGMRERATAEGRWVKTIVCYISIVQLIAIEKGRRHYTLTLPIRLAIEDATSVDAEQIMFVTKKMEPRLPSWRSNLRLKKYVIQDLRDLGHLYFLFI